MKNYRQIKNEPLQPHLREILNARTTGIERELLEFQQREPERQGQPRLDLARAVLSMSHGGLSGEDREYLEEVAQRNGRPFDSMRPFLEFRDLQKAVAGSGGYFVGTETRDPIDILRPFSVTKRMGMVIETGLVGDQAVPKVSAKTTAGWFSMETFQVTPTQSTLVQIPLVPKQIGDVVVFSRQLAKQTNAARFVGRELLRTIGTAIDQAVISGPGSSGQPLGILNTAGVQIQSGTTLNAGVNTMKRKSAEANATDEQIAFLSTPAVRELLEGRERATGGGRFVWDKDQVSDRAAFVSTDVPTATMICGDFSLLYLGIWGEGFVLEINPYDPSGFKAGLIQGRMLVNCDIAVLHPSAFVVATSIG